MLKKQGLISALTVMTLILSGCSGLTVELNANKNTKVPEDAQAAQSALAVATATVVPENPAAQPPSLEAMQESLRAVYDAVNPSVVNLRVVQKATIAVESTVPGLPQIPGLPFDLPQDQPSQEFRQEGQGSGFIWDKSGNIVTNNHVIAGVDQVTVTFSDGTSVEGKVIGADPDSDLAVVKVVADASKLKPVKLADSTKADVGQIVIAIGNPFGLEGTMTFGIVSGLGRSLPVSSDTSTSGPSYTIPDIIQTDAPINPGNSGGVLVNIEGNVLGVTSAIESPVRASAGVGFVVPSSTVQKVIPALIKSGTFAHTWLGISGTTLSPELIKAAGLTTGQRGVIVIEVTPGSPAEKAKVQGSDKEVEIDGQKAVVGGDIITAIDAQTVNEFDDLVTYLARSTVVGQKVTLTILRENKEQSLEVTLAARPKTEEQTTQVADETPSTSPVWLGIEALPLNIEINKAMGLADDQTGVLIQQVEPKSPAEKAGLRGSSKPFTLDGNQILIGGDVITAIDGKDTPTMNDLKTELGRHKVGEEVTLNILREKSEMKIQVKLEERPIQ